MDELASKLDTTFSMVSYLSTSIISIVYWYVDTGAYRHVTFNKKALSRLKEYEASIQEVLGNGACYRAIYTFPKPDGK